MIKKSSSQRNDIQCLRTFAVLGVILFHIWPKTFPNGYLGVDIFFVISGFLMTATLSNVKHMRSSKMFYFQRIKRIFPLCLFVIFVTIVAGKYLLLASYFRNLLTEALWAIIFGTNMRTLIQEENYFTMVEEYKFLLHTWSLGVEIQYYLIVPLLFRLVNFINKPLTPVIGLAIISYFFQFYLNLFGYQSAAFNFVLCRIWQFMCGWAAFYYSFNDNSNVENDEINLIVESNIKKNLNKQLIFVFILFIIVFLPTTTASYMKLIRTLATPILSCLIISAPQQYHYNSSVIERLTKICIYLGDASYSLYLTHWPIIVFMKYFNLMETNCLFYKLLIDLTTFFAVHLYIIFFVIFAVGIAIHEVVEKPLRNSSNFINIFVILIFYAFFIVFYLTQQTNVVQAIEIKNMTLDEKIAYNIEMSQEPKDDLCIKDENIERFYLINTTKLHDWRCSHTLVPNVTNKKEAVVIGNSYAAAQFSGISQALKQFGFTKVYLIARSGCLPHGGDLNHEYNQTEYECNKWIENAFDSFLLAVKPQFIFISARLSMFTQLMTPLPPPEQLPNDFGIQQLQRGILALSKFTKKLIFISPNPDIEFSNLKLDAVHLDPLKAMINFTYNSASNVARNLQLGLPLKEFILPLKYAYEVTHAPDVRLMSAMKSCSNCLFFNTSEIFCNKNGCPLYDEKTELAVLRDTSHLSVTAVEKLGNALVNFLSNKISL